MPLGKGYLQEPDEHVIGKVADIREEAQEWGKSIVVELTPIGAETSQFIMFNATNATGRRSKWQRFLKGLRAINIDTSDENNIIGKIIDFKLVEQSFTTPEGEDRTFDVWKPERYFDSEAEALVALQELEAAGAIPAGPQVPGDEEQPDDEGDDEIPASVLTAAMTVYVALERKDDLFLSTAANSWPDYDGAKLLELVKG